MEVVNVMDVSSFLLFEATGDSEEDSDPSIADVSHDIAMADDDAESCSYDSSDSRVVDELGDCHLRACVDDEGEDDGPEEEEEEVEEDGHGYQPWGMDHNWRVTGRQKSSGSADSSKQLMDEAEKNRLFWESCLAS